MHFDTMPNQTPLRYKATSALAGSDTPSACWQAC